MACTTCDHTMQGIGEDWYWCPRCGSILPPVGVVEPPKLVATVRRYLRTHPSRASELAGVARDMNEQSLPPKWRDKE